MLKKLLALSPILFLTGCYNVEGKLEVYKNLHFKKHVAITTPSRISVPAGRYSAEAKFSNKWLTVKIDDIRGIYFRLPKNEIALSNYNSVVPFDISAAESEQLYDLNGYISTNITQSDQTKTYETCTYYVTEHCQKTGSDGKPIWTTCSVPVSGQQYVEYHFVYTHRDYQVNIVEPDSKELAAKFDGGRDESDKVYDFTGRCVGNGGYPLR